MVVALCPSDYHSGYEKPAQVDPLLTIAELSFLCQDETTRYWHREPVSALYGLELFRRAVMGNETAWVAVYTQYAGLVRSWLRGWTHDENEVEDGVVAAFEKFWRALDAAKFSRFGSLGAVLQYLKQCAYTGHLDHVRLTRARESEIPLDETSWDVPDADDLEAHVSARVDAPLFWRTVQQVVDDERAFWVLYFSYHVGLRPQEICARYEANFPDVAEVYRLKRTALDRLRQAPVLQGLMRSL